MVLKHPIIERLLKSYGVQVIVNMLLSSLSLIQSKSKKGNIFQQIHAMTNSSYLNLCKRDLTCYNDCSP